MKTFHFNFMHSLKESQVLRMDDANEIMQFLVQRDEKKMIEDGLFKPKLQVFSPWDTLKFIRKLVRPKGLSQIDKNRIEIDYVGRPKKNDKVQTELQ